MSDLVGQTLGDFLIEAELGRGGMGVVYRARDKRLDIIRAIKVMHDQFTADPHFQQRFLQEAKAPASLKHPNLLEVLAFSQDGNRFYMVMEYVGDGSLRSLLQQHERGPREGFLKQGLQLVMQTGEGLGFIHSRNMVHRDVKPDNLLLTRPAPGQSAPGGFVVKVGDFGLVRIASASQLTATGVPVGTPWYMSPEQCRGAQLDGRSDIYALGVILYEVATGLRPFEISSLEQAIYKHVYEQPRPPSQSNPGLPPELDTIVLRCLAKKPEDRYATTAELNAELQKLLGPEIPITTTPPAPAYLSGSGSRPPIQPPTPSEARIEVRLANGYLTIMPGQPARMQGRLSNLGDTVDTLKLSVEGVPEEWVAIQVLGETSSGAPSDEAHLMPGNEATFTLAVDVPRTTESLARPYNVTVRARSYQSGKDFVAQAVWTVRPFFEHRLELKPKKASGRTRATYIVVVHNTSNARGKYQLKAETGEEHILSTFNLPQLDCEPGEVKGAKLTISAPRRWIGVAKTSQFKVQSALARGDSSGGGSSREARESAREEQGQFLHKAVMPPWTPAIVAAVFIGGFALARWMIPHPPSVNHVEQTKAAEEEVTLTGDYLGGSGEIALGDGHPFEPKSWQHQQIVFTVPKNLPIGSPLAIHVIPAGHRALDAGHLTVMQPTTVVKLGGDRRPNERITLSGQALGSLGSVFVGGQPARIIDWSSDHVDFEAPAKMFGLLPVEIQPAGVQKIDAGAINVVEPAAPPPPPVIAQNNSDQQEPVVQHPKPQPSSEASPQAPKPRINPLTDDNNFKVNQKVTLSGVHLGTEQGQVWLQDKVARVIAWEDQKITFLIPHRGPFGEEVPIRVTMPDNTQLDGGTIIIAPPPGVDAINASLTPHQWATIRGHSLGSMGTVQLNGRPIPRQFVRWSDQQVVFLVPTVSPGQPPLDIGLITQDGTQIDGGTIAVAGQVANGQSGPSIDPNKVFDFATGLINAFGKRGQAGPPGSGGPTGQP